SVVWANRAFRRWLNLRAEDLERKPLEQLIPIPSLRDWLGPMECGPTLTRPEPFTTRVNDREVQVSAIPIRAAAEDGEVEMLLLLQPAGSPEPQAAPEPSPPAPAETK